MNNARIAGYGVILSVLGFLPVACRGPQVPVVMQGAALQSDAATRDVLLYVTGNGNNQVAVYNLSKSGFPLFGTITDGVSSPGGVALDKKGRVYVANETGTVTVYPPGQTTPMLTLRSGLESPESVIVDASGDVYVCNRGSHPDIVVFPPAKSTPSQIIANNLIQVPTQIQFDETGDLYYTDNNTGVSKIAAGSQSMVNLNLKDLQRTNGIALDRYGNLYVGTFGSALDGVREFLPGEQRPVRTLRNAQGSDLYTSGLLKRQQYIFLPDSYDSTVKAFKPDSTRPDFVVNAAEAQASVGVAVKGAGVP